MFLKHSQTYPPFFSVSRGTPRSPHVPCEGWRHFQPRGRLCTSSPGKSRVIAAAHQLTARGRHGPAAPSRSSPQTCHPSRLPLLCPCHCLVFGELRGNAGALQQEGELGRGFKQAPAAPHSLGIPESAASGASPRHKHRGLGPFSVNVARQLLEPPGQMQIRVQHPRFPTGKYLPAEACTPCGWKSSRALQLQMGVIKEGEGLRRLHLLAQGLC